MSLTDAPLKRQRMEDLSNSQMDVEEVVVIPVVVPMADREIAPSLEAFLGAPHIYQPQQVFLNSLLVDDETVLTHAVKNQNADAVATLLEAGMNPNISNKKGVTPISAAAHKGNTIIMQTLIDAGSDVNALNSSGSTALIQASHFGHVDAVKLLLSHQASADFANHKGTTALMRAAQEGHLDISTLLLTAKAEVNRKNHEGMNALMLASQRGHSEMVHLLITKGAVMDEQTSQGSTALMLACKRGHDKCVEVLVGMGAEIYIKDTRGRTARDTATRRNHFGLLACLDTQVQVRKVQEYRRGLRTDLLLAIRGAQQKGCLRLTTADTRAHLLVYAVKVTTAMATNGITSSSSSAFSYATTASAIAPPLAASASSSSSRVGWDGRAKWRPPSLTLDEARELVSRPENRLGVETIREALDPKASAPPAPRYAAVAGVNTGSQLATRPPGYMEWQWPTLLLRCMDLPPGLFELIVEMLPLPRIWLWSLSRLKKCCKLAPHQAIFDMSIIMDEILADACIFTGSNQKSMLGKISRNPEMHPHLTSTWGMSASLVESLSLWSDTQSLVYRVSETDVTFRSPMAKKMLDVVNALYRWHKHRTNSGRTLGFLHANAHAMMHGSSSGGSNMAYPKHEEGDEDDGEDADGIATDAGGEEESQSDGEGLGEEEEEEVLDQDTETELPVEVDDDDSDAEGNEQGQGHTHAHHHNHNNIVLGFGTF